MSVFRQIAVHNFTKAAGLPLEITHEIMSFCFYDTITAVYRAVHRANMTDIVDGFNNAYISRARPRHNMMENPDSCEHWAICLDDDVQFQAVSCGVCGNYKSCDTYRPQQIVYGEGLDHLFREAIPIRMRCCCHIEY